MNLMDTTIDDRIRGALSAYEQVNASVELRRQVLGLSAMPRTRRRTRVLLGAVAAAAATIAVPAVLSLGGTNGTNDPAVGARAVDLREFDEVVFADGASISMDELEDPANHERLKAVFAEHGAELVVTEQPALPWLDGVVIMLLAPSEMFGDGDSDVIELLPGGRMEVVVGRAEPPADVGEAWPLQPAP